MTELYDRLHQYSNSDYYGFHMPGHKRNAERFGSGLPYGIDITEIEEFDDLHHPDGILKKAQEEASRVYGAGETRFLVNGSTAGILSAILGCTRKGDQVLVGRNCHKSVYHAIYMNELEPVYLYPGFRPDIQLNTEISVSAVKAALNEHSRVKAVILVSPTYDGVVSDIRGIAGEVHKRGIPLIVDEAHGAHFGFHPYFPESALRQGADVVIHSLHKTLPALTQTALLHVEGDLADRERIFRYLDMLQSSSPSYVLMAGIDRCIHLLGEKREELFAPYVEGLEKLRQRLAHLEKISLAETEHYDRSKLVLSVAGADMTGRELYLRLLETYHLQLEMAAGSYALAMTSVGDTEEGFRRLGDALEEIDRSAGERPAGAAGFTGALPKNETVLTSARMEESSGEKESVRKLPLEECAGHVSTEYAYLYPPGIPVIVPGERISRESVEMLLTSRSQGFSLEGMEEEGSIRVWING
ncbi:aminotransferase class I/II-fold pyridoxal phosphate-dependent enzyme [Lachnospiraceae bacterium DSM 108991]|uniref:Aminotransferase class I/II-fold pyridoxal phosphate-dependent enzyme n=1 Tax=Claveliimonas monacensis TaxID=2779351 RepID=A0ABR9RMA8_9FIRM|nr:aminotransferase class I/II-fold pyridoxal phosphate-dependent enzyme [Claveliimonas monacensis]MBE5064093.1 aminotransferase class I/II-fold pyridoxal phosphate-dependent enzyme [Claveliimonas monacensis]